MPRSTMWHGNVKITARSDGGGLVGVLVALVVAVGGWWAVYSVADAVLVGVAASAAAANLIVACAVAAVIGAGVLAGGWWLLAGRHVVARRDEVARQHALAVSTEIGARQLERARRRALEAGLARELERGRAVRMDMQTGPGADTRPWDREPVELDGRWTR